MKKNPFYVSNKKFYEEMSKYRDAVEKAKSENKEIPRPNDYIGSCVWLIAHKLSNKPCYNKYSYKDEMIDDGIENAIKSLNNFDHTKYNNPFAFFTTIINNAFIRRIKCEKKEMYLKYKNMQDFDLTCQLIDNTYVPSNNEIANKFIKEYEISLAAQKEKMRKKNENTDSS